MHFVFTNDELSPHLLRKDITDINAGGYVSFEGWVRKINNNKEVSHLRYEAYQKLAYKEADKILIEAKNKFSLLTVSTYHRLGIINLGEIAVWIGVSAKHRKEAFLACEYIIDNLKKRLPIWKEEFYTDGSSSWVTCSHQH